MQINPSYTEQSTAHEMLTLVCRKYSLLLGIKNCTHDMTGDFPWVCFQHHAGTGIANWTRLTKIGNSYMLEMFNGAPALKKLVMVEDNIGMDKVSNQFAKATGLHCDW